MKYMAALVLVAAMSAQSAPSTSKSPDLDIPAIAREANGSVVSIVMSDKDGHPLAQGSGFLISKDGHIVTNYHVIKNGSSAVIKLPDGAFFAVDGLLASDKKRDVAIIKAHGNNFRILRLGDSDRLEVGQEVIAIGSPLSLESTVSNGIVSGFRTVEEEGGKFLQITVPISPGSSGGPLFNMAGKVVGITTSHLVGGENLNFAIPINDVKPLLLDRSSKARALPDEAEDDTASVGPDPIVFNDQSGFEKRDGLLLKPCDPSRQDIDCQYINRETGFVEAFATEPACHGLTLLRESSHAPRSSNFWHIDVSRFAWLEPCLKRGAEVRYIYNDDGTIKDKIFVCKRYGGDGGELGEGPIFHWEFFVHYMGEKWVDPPEPDGTLPITDAVRMVCTIVAGAGGAVK